MKPVQVTAHVDQAGKLQLDQLPMLPPGEDLRVLIMQENDITTLSQLVDMVATMEISDPDLLARLESLDDALWDIQFASSQDTLAKLAQQALAEHKAGKTVPLELDELNRTE
jgi:hypothetical protein